ncbi:MAG: UDP-N-acetylmuramoyl-L-alanyl-D-glutamate--2,6-diaminopimelate ligase [Crocinitomicaceae bacterium]|nr:UDP-N-acetylmuramoyl-L-alanyl-D-glutamate--2,6-diaminopimelate ligase [Crocinitomicaceae bacterium]|tara:strand:+ start:8593 stop:10059 length:1467 start_codon:yes stop_codon:yes gene_type:complete
MRLLKDILYRVPIENVIGNTNVALENICFDSREVGQFTAFVAIPGTQVDGHRFIDNALDAGANAIICEELPEETRDEVCYVKVQNCHAALALMACNYYDNPSEKLNLVGITGTNGKTTTATLLQQLFINLGYKTGLLSTVVNKIQHEEIASTHTTPNPLELNALLARMLEEGCTHCFMEVSSHALVQRRTEGLHFKIAVFTNITHDHLDYHETFDNYIAAKKMLFDGLGSSAFALVNRDDFHGEVMLQNTKAKQLSFGLKTMADYKAKVVENDFDGLQLNINGNDVWTHLIGKFNAYNLLCAYAVAEIFEEDNIEILTQLSQLTPVKGRFQYIRSETNITGIVDYAHTPDALKNVLETINDIRTGNEKVITVVGCGGDRDKDKRPKMANIACKGSDKVIFTSDNPRSENPDQIIEDMQAGVEGADFKKTFSITNRKEAIKTAVAFAEPNDIILVAGKGHENYQIIGDEVFDFNDMEIISEYLIQLTSS